MQKQLSFITNNNDAEKPGYYQSSMQPAPRKKRQAVLNQEDKENCSFQSNQTFAKPAQEAKALKPRHLGLEDHPQQSFLVKKHSQMIENIEQKQEKAFAEAFSSRKTTEIEREILHVNLNFGQSIDQYLRKLELEHSTADCLLRHKITPVLRSRMVDWMVEVMTNFRCDDQTYFLAVSCMDRYFQRV